MHELKVPLLKKDMQATENAMKEHKKEWTKVNSSISSDGWCDSVASKDIVNLLVNSPKAFDFTQIFTTLICNAL